MNSQHKWSCCNKNGFKWYYSLTKTILINQKWKELKVSVPDLCNTKIINPGILRHDGSARHCQSVTSSQSAKSGTRNKWNNPTGFWRRRRDLLPKSQLHITGRTDSKQASKQRARIPRTDSVSTGLCVWRWAKLIDALSNSEILSYILSGYTIDLQKRYNGRSGNVTLINCPFYCTYKFVCWL